LVSRCSATANRNPATAEFLAGPEGEDMYEDFNARPVIDLDWPVMAGRVPGHRARGQEVWRVTDNAPGVMGTSTLLLIS